MTASGNQTQRDLIVEITGMGVQPTIGDFIAAVEQHGWKREILSQPPKGLLERGLFGIKVHLPESALTDLRSLIWDLRHQLPESCYANTVTHSGEPAVSDLLHGSLSTVVSAMAEQQAAWKAESRHIRMGL